MTNHTYLKTKVFSCHEITQFAAAFTQPVTEAVPYESYSESMEGNHIAKSSHTRDV